MTHSDSRVAPGAPLVPFGWHWMQIALLISGIAGLGAGLWQSTWSNTKYTVVGVYDANSELADWVSAQDVLRDNFSALLKWTSLAQLTLSAALVIGGTLMGARITGLRISLVAIGWLGIAYAVIGSSVYVRYLVNWASWSGASSEPLLMPNLPAAWTGWALAIAIGLLGFGKLLFFIIVVGYFGRFDVRAYLEDPPAWFYATSASAAP